MAKTKIKEEELPSNSKSSRVAPMRAIVREQENEGGEISVKHVKKSIQGSAVVKKKTITQSIAGSFLSDEMSGIGGYILNSVLVPAFKELFSEIITSGVQMLLYGETKPRSRDKGDRTTVSYNKYYNSDRDERSPRRRGSSRDKFDLSDIYFRYGDEADKVLTDLCDLVEEFEAATVADYFELAGIDGATWAHNNYGWNDLRRAYCSHTRNGYTIVLPDPIPLD